MTDSYLEHPNEETLERFLLHRSEDQELEVVETHILACESCITRLENLELQINDLKAALGTWEEQRIQKELNPKPSFWKSWFSTPNLSWAGAACAALILGLTFIPHSLRNTQNSPHGTALQVAERDLSACAGTNGTDTDLATCRGVEIATLPENRPLNLRLDATDIPEGPVDVQVVSADGSEIWQGQTMVSNQRARVKLPQISQPGPYFLRFYAPGAGTERELLREFRFEVK
jgi:hypothetical protein